MSLCNHFSSEATQSNAKGIVDYIGSGGFKSCTTLLGAVGGNPGFALMSLALDQNTARGNTTPSGPSHSLS